MAAMENKISAPAAPVADGGASSVHTDLPWRSEPCGYGFTLVEPDGGSMGAIYPETLLGKHLPAAANAAFIVRACNAHEALVEALRALHDDCAEYARINNLGGYDNHVMRMARAALSLASEGR